MWAAAGAGVAHGGVTSPACPLPGVSMMPILSPWCHRCALSPQGRFRRPSPPPVRATGSLWGTDKELRVPCGHWEIPAVVGAAVLPASPQSSAEMNREQCFPNLSLFSTDVAAFQQRQHLAACWEGRGWGFLQVRCCRGCAKRRLAPALSVSAAALPGLAGTRGAVAATR